MLLQQEIAVLRHENSTLRDEIQLWKNRILELNRQQALQPTTVETSRPIAVQTINNYRRYVSGNPPRYDSGQLSEGEKLQMVLDTDVLGPDLLDDL